jgi:hypothetical protein
MGDQTKDSTIKPWLVLMHQMPARPEALRVRVWRRLQKLGAIQLKNSVYMLPDSPYHRNRAQELATDIRNGGGDAFLFGATWVEGIREDDLRSRYEERLADEIRPLIKEGRKWTSLLAKKRNADALMDALHIYGKLVGRLKEFRARDHFGSQTIADLESGARSLAVALFGGTGHKAQSQPAIRNRASWVWVTRRKPGVDRLSSAWLIKRFIDGNAEIMFVDMDSYEHQKDHLRFDVFAGEFTHEEDRCTFEVLLERFGIHDSALKTLGQIIHDLDLEDDKFQRSETEEVRKILLESMKSENDQERFLRACEGLDNWMERQTRNSECNYLA